MASTTFQPVGPAFLYLGNATTGMRQLQLVRNVVFNSGNRMAFTSADAQSGVPIATGIYALAANAEVQADMQELGLQTMKDLILGATSTPSGSDEVIGAPDTFKKIAAENVPTLAIIPADEVGDGVDAPNGIWLPAVTIQGPNNLQFGRVEEGEITQGFNVTFQAAYRAQDQGATDIPVGNRIWFSGPPAGLSLTWSFA